MEYLVKALVMKMLGLGAVLFMFISPFLCQQSYLDTLTKCSIEDNECLKNSFQKVFKEIGKTGIPEVDIPPIDPMHLHEVPIKIIDDLTLTLKDGVVKGLRSCALGKFIFDVEKESGSQELICDIINLKGYFSLSGTSPLIQSLVGSGESLNGSGKARVKIEKLKMDFVFPFAISKNEDGDTYINVAYKKIKYTYDIGKVTFITENIVIANNDISQIVSSYLNQNWRNLMKSFGKVFIDKAMEFYFGFLKKFYEGVPTKYFIIEDLTPYVH